ncbi:MAG: RNA-binding transcriptional accessory protein, partial [Saprospiraceae bacterium]|nr:RNA-binding transcriptional accessory protein [Saprospiraceae bacterium]
MTSQHIQIIANTLGLKTKGIENTIALFQDGATIPFIARYRKEATGSLDEVEIAAIHREMKKLEELEKRRETVLKSIEEQGKLTDELRRRIEGTYDPVELEDIYLPYKPKRKTKASVAREKGLEPLAQVIFAQQRNDVDVLAKAYLNEQVASVEEALQGARDIMAEWVNEDEKSRGRVRYAFEKDAIVRSKVARGKEEEAAKYRDYFDYEEVLKKCPSHRLLAIRRGEEEGFLRVVITPADEDAAIGRIEQLHVKNSGRAAMEVKAAIRDSYERLLAPSIETEFRNKSKEKADKEAIEVFAQNLRQLLLAPPLGERRVMGIDPGFRTGCKVVCLDASGNLLHNTTIYPHPPQSDTTTAIKNLQHLAERFQIEAIAVGNGTAGRETLSLCQGIGFSFPVEVFMVNEA